MDYDYNKPMLDVTGSSSVSPIGVGEQVTYGNRFFTPDKGTALATIRAEDLRAQAKSYHGGGQDHFIAVDFEPGIVGVQEPVGG